MSELTLLLLRIGFLVLLWVFVFAIVYSLRADLFGVKVRRMPEPAAAAAPRPPRPAVGHRPRGAGRGRRRPPRRAAAATTATVSRIVITSGPKAGLELPLGPSRSRSAARASPASSSATTTPPATTRASCCGASSG